jgi:hypothetical protein
MTIPSRRRPVAIADADGHMWTRALALSDNGCLLDAVTKHKDGYLIADAKVARVGLQKYKGFEVGLPDRDNVVLYRPASEVFATDSMRSHANKPVTLTHPKQMVDSKTWGKVAKGFSGSDVVRDGEYVRVPLMLTDAAAIAAYERGKARELSVGYTTDIDWTAGTTPSGEPYDGVQREIRTNHHALVPVARGGENLRFGDADVQFQSQGAGLTQCGNCGSQLTGSPEACPNCGFDLKPQMRSEWDDTVMEDFSPDQARGSDGKWTAAQVASMKNDLKNAMTSILAKHGAYNPTSDINAEDYDDNDQNWISTAALLGQQLTNPHTGAVSSAAGKDPPGAINVKLAPGQEGSYRMDSAYWLDDRAFTAEERKSGAKAGWAKADGSYPIRNTGDLKNAISAWGRGGATASDKSWIKKRAKALGAEGMLPDDWKTDAADSGNEGVTAMATIKTFDGVPIQFADEVSAGAMSTYVMRLIKDADGAKAKSKKDNDDDTAEATAQQKKAQAYEDSIKAKDGEIAVLKKQVADAQLTDSQINDRAAELVRVFDSAKALLPKDWNPVNKSAKEIRRAAVANQMGDAAIKDWDDATVTGAFEALARSGKGNGAAKLADGMSRDLKSTDNRSAGGRSVSLADAEADAAKAYAEMVSGLTTAYKTPVSYKSN